MTTKPARHAWDITTKRRPRLAAAALLAAVGLGALFLAPFGRSGAADAKPGTRSPNATPLFLRGGRFRVDATWQTASQSGAANGVALTTDTGYFWFFDSSNVEVVVKVLDACGVNSRFWVFAAGLTNVRVILTVTDMQTGLQRTYENPLGTPFSPLQDTSAFATCGGTSPGPAAAFPGAEGFGATATGGRGGRVIYVTNRNASGPGSLQDALDQTGPRTILFKVSGVIQGVPELHTQDVTIAGQTSPGGVILRGLYIQGDTVCETEGCPLPTSAPRNFIVRHLRLRPAGEPDADDGLRLHRAKLGIVDHVSIGNANDEAIQISLSSDVTIQHTLLAETLGDHVEFGGMLLNYSDPVRGFPLTRLSIHHNMWNRIFGRLPELSRENIPSAAGSTMDLDLTNNVAYDPRRPMLVNHGSGVNSDPAGPSIYYNLNLVGNYFFGAPAFDHGMLTFVGPPVGSETRMFFQDNRINRFPTVQDYQLIYCCNGFGQAVANGEVDYPNPAAPPFFAQSTRHPFPPITTQPSGPSLLDFLLARVGARPRDAMDTRLLARVSARTFESAPLDQNPAGDALAVNPSPPAAPLDTDGDGMPDSWEIANGLDPNVPDNNGTGLSVPLTGVSGYTNIEVYLNQLADSLIP